MKDLKINDSFVAAKKIMQMVAILFQWIFLFSFFTGAKPAPAISAVDAAHPYFVSVTEINYNTAEKNLEVTCKIFADDLELALREWSKSAIDISAEKEKQKADHWISDYIAKHLALKTDGRPLALKYVGFEKEKEAVYGYFEVSQPTAPKKLELTNSLLLELHPDQMNIVHAVVNGKRQSIKLSSTTKEASFSF